MNVYRDKIKLRHHQCGENCKLKLKSIFDIFQDAAAEHADIIGCGMENMLKTKTMWVLIRQKTEIIRLPGVGEEVSVETYPRGTDKLFAIREYRVYGSDGAVAIRGTANWLILDIDTLRPQRLSGAFFEMVPDNTHLPVSFEKIEKLEVVDDESAKCFSVAVKSSDIDMNRHLNNANYAAMIQDALHLHGIAIDQINTVEINYLNSGQLGDEITVKACFSDKESNVSGSINGKAAFGSRITLK